MAAEARRAPSVREHPRLPAVVQLPAVHHDDPLPALGIYDHIPDGFDVTPIRTCVAVFSREEIGTTDLIEGGIYVYENQRPVALSPFPDSRRICTRKVVRIYRDSRVEGTWRVRDLDRPFVPGDGPYYDWGLADMLIGRVVGVYQPNAAVAS